MKEGIKAEVGVVRERGCDWGGQVVRESEGETGCGWGGRGRKVVRESEGIATLDGQLGLLVLLLPQ